MKKVSFKKLSIQNFLSVGNEPVVINFERGINIITGSNLDKEGSKNGVGKSTICDAIYFCLFGETLRELKKDHITNRLTSGTCKVILSFDVDENGTTTPYVLMRSINPTTIQLLQVGLDNPDITKSTIPKTTEFVSKLINCTPDVFEQSILMSLNGTLPFMAQKKVEKRKFIEGILKLGIFSDMLLSVRQNYNEIKKEYDTEKVIIDETQTTLDHYVTQQENQNRTRIERVKNLQERIHANVEEIKELKTKITQIDVNNIQKLKTNLSLLEMKEKEYIEKRHNLQTEIATYSVDINNHQKQLSNLLSIGLACDKCNRLFSDADKSDIERKKHELTQNINEANTLLENVKKEQLTFKELSEKCKKASNILNSDLYKIALTKKENENIENRINQILSINKQTDRDIKNIESEQNDFNDLITNAQQKIESITSTISQLSKKLEVVDGVKFVVSEEGVKSFIVKKILKLLNSRLSLYLKKLDANCRCEFNEYFEELIIDDKGKECSYHNFSGGEKKRIDLAMLFTFQDLRRLQGDVAINISMYDELLDSSLDGRGVECVMGILKERADTHNEALYIITHNNHALNIPVDKTIQLIKYNGITKLSE